MFYNERYKEKILTVNLKKSDLDVFIWDIMGWRSRGRWKVGI